MTVYACTLSTPLGEAVADARENAIVGFWFAGQKHFPREREGRVEKADYPPFVRLKNWLAAYFTGENVAPGFALRPEGTAFQKTIWNLLLQIPYGTLVTYGDIAKRAANARGSAKQSARAVGNAVGRNPISILIPCHRVVGATGDLTGYAGGLDRKRALLRLEGALA